MRQPIAIFGLAVVMSSPVAVLAERAAPEPLFVRLAQAEVVVVAKVVKIEDKTVDAPANQDQPKEAHTIFVLKVSETLHGANELTNIRIGIPSSHLVNRKRRYYDFDLKEGQSYCVLLNKHFQENFFVISDWSGGIPQKFIDSSGKEVDNPDFDKSVAEIKKSANLLKDPLAGLKSKDADDRFISAAMLITRYRMPSRPIKNAKTEPIDAAESKAILEALADADWTFRNPRLGAAPYSFFFKLGITEKDGWTRPRDPQQISKAAQEWLKKHAATFRIHKIVEDKSSK